MNRRVDACMYAASYHRLHGGKRDNTLTHMQKLRSVVTRDSEFRFGYRNNRPFGALTDYSARFALVPCYLQITRTIYCTGRACKDFGASIVSLHNFISIGKRIPRRRCPIRQNEHEQRVDRVLNQVLSVSKQIHTNVHSNIQPTPYFHHMITLLITQNGPGYFGMNFDDSLLVKPICLNSRSRLVDT